ncbi:heme exporter protein CcmD [Faucicola boevrei]|uniref:heme exporter protein CcmD n=1 Tax=Faucicola boevrei TaxID=346665 RepID=UPI00037FB9F0|nr:heme exporter protein CcmD [Moraxella boevrei]
MNFYFNNFTEFLNMGGHGFYVWASYGFSFACLIGIIIYSRSERQNTLKRIYTQHVRQNQRQRTK